MYSSQNLLMLRLNLSVWAMIIMLEVKEGIMMGGIAWYSGMKLVTTGSVSIANPSPVTPFTSAAMKNVAYMIAITWVSTRLRESYPISHFRANGWVG